jgi:hypothetical protein
MKISVIPHQAWKIVKNPNSYKYRKQEYLYQYGTYPISLSYIKNLSSNNACQDTYKYKVRYGPVIEIHTVN